MSSVKGSREDLLRRAIRDALLETDDAFGVGSLSSLIRSERDRAILREETAPPQAMLDLHLIGVGVEGHATSARRLGAFLSRVSEATKEIAKGIARASSYSENILVEGFSPGSVRIVLRAPDVVPRRDDTLVDGIFESADSKALRRVASVFALASEDDELALDSDPLAAAVEVLSIAARGRLRSAADVVLAADWEIDGTVRQARQVEESVRVTQRGASKLKSALELSLLEPQTRTIVGTLDGFRRGLGVAYVKPVDSGGTLAVAVTESDLFHRVAEMAAVENLPVRIVVRESQTERPDGAPGRITRRLVEVSETGRPSAPFLLS